MLLPFLQYHNRFPRSHNTFISVSLLPLPLFSYHPVPQWSVLVFCFCLFLCLSIGVFSIVCFYYRYMSYFLFVFCFVWLMFLAIISNISFYFYINVLVLCMYIYIFIFPLAFSSPLLFKIINLLFTIYPFLQSITAHTNLYRTSLPLAYLLSYSHPVFPLFFLSPPSFSPLPLSTIRKRIFLARAQ